MPRFQQHPMAGVRESRSVSSSSWWMECESIPKLCWPAAVGVHLGKLLLYYLFHLKAVDWTTKHWTISRVNGEVGESSSGAESRANGTTGVVPISNSVTAVSENGGGARPRTRSNDVETAPIPVTASSSSRTPNGTPQQTPSRTPNGTAAPPVPKPEATTSTTAPATPAAAPPATPAGPEDPLPPG